jgi:thioester reductase-like protein
MRHVLLTGATGVVGSGVLPYFLNDADVRVTLLLRATDEARLRDRAKALFDFVRPQVVDVAAFDRVRLVAGDVSLDRLGLREDVYGELGRSLTNIVHCAASVELTLSLEESLRHSLTAVERVLELQARGDGVKLDYVSTVGVNGRLRAPLTERRVTEAREFFNTYEAGKARAEERVFAAMDQGRAITVHRPSMVVGHSQTGAIPHFQVFYFLMKFLSGRLTAGWVPDFPGKTIDTIPMDVMGRILYESSRRPDAAGAILHACAAERSWSAERLAAAARRAAERAGLSLPRRRRAPWGVFRALATLGGWPVWGEKTRKRLSLLPQFLAYAAQPQLFANDNSCRRFAGWGISVPTPESYIEPVLDYHANAPAQRGARFTSAK